MLSCSRLFVCAIFESTVSRQKENFVCSAESPTRLGNAWKIIFFKMAPTKIEFVESTMLSGLVSSHTWSPFVLRRLQDSGKWSLITKHGSVACTGNLEEKQGNVPTIHVASPNLQVISSA